MKSIVYNSDCLEAMRAMPDKAFDLACVDPPYGIGADATQNEQAASGRISNGGGWKVYKQTSWDKEIPSEEYFNELKRVARQQIIWGGNYFPTNLSGVVIWDKGVNGTMKEGELAATSFNTFKTFRMSRVDAYINGGDGKIHPTQKPVALYRWLLTNYAKPGDTILDTHLGSGSSRIAAYDLGFDFTGYELDKDYFEAQEARFANHIAQARLFDAPVLETVEQNPLF
jgi:site-specific DNA-methyltransferase (adenine-specific)